METILKRKNTTKIALKDLEHLLKSLQKEVLDDLKPFVSKAFTGRMCLDNGLYMNDFNYRSWVETTFYIYYEDGNINIVYDDINNPEYTVVQIEDFTNINFSELREALNDFVEKYNKIALAKDLQVEEFQKLQLIKVEV